MRGVAGVLVAALAAGCGPALSADRVRVEALPADLLTGPATRAVQTRDGVIFVAPISGGFQRLSKDGASWEVLADRPMLRALRDWKDGLTLAEGAERAGIFRAQGDHFEGFEPPVPTLPGEAFSNVGWSAVRGRDVNGVFWATAAPTFSAQAGQLIVGHLEPAAPTEWKFDAIALVEPKQTIPASQATMASDGQLYFRPNTSGIWRVDLVNHALVEVITCAHELFRATGPDYADCLEDTVLAAGPRGELFILNPHREVWRLAAGETAPTLVVKAGLDKLPLQDDAGFNKYSPGGYQLYADPKGRLWLGFRWGNNGPDDTSWLYAADPATGDQWAFIKGDLPRNTALFGDANTPLLSSGSQDTGLLVFRVVE